MAATREQRVEENMMDIPEGFELDGDPYIVPAEERDALDEAFEAAKYVLRFYGGVTWFVPVRVEVKPGTGIYRTVEYAFFWNSYVPPKKADEAIEEKVAHAERETVEVG
jgi:hypothetical protein